MTHIANIVDVSRYPIDQLDSPQGKMLVSDIQMQLKEDGSCTLEDFVIPEVLQRMRCEAMTLTELAYPGPTSVSPYFFNYNIGKGLGYDNNHPTKHKGKRNLKQIAADLIPQNHLLSMLYRSSEMTDFLSLVLEQPVYEFKDPFQSLNISVMNAGGCQQWHFDSGQMVTTLLLQEPKQGGVFEYAPNIRSEENENFDEVKKVLQGKSSRVKSLHLKPGMLSLFKGHYSLHRVTEVSGDQLRLQAILAYVTDPSRMGSIDSSIVNYGPRVAKLSSSKIL